MITTTISVSSPQHDVVEDIINMANEAKLALLEDKRSKFVDITHNMQICADYSFKALAEKIKTLIFDICWDIDALDRADLEKNIEKQRSVSLIDKWHTAIINNCKEYSL